MKKRLAIWPILVLGLVVLTACGQSRVRLELTDFQTLRIFGEDYDLDEIRGLETIKEVKEEEKGRLTIVMEKKEQEKLLENMRKELDQLMENTRTSSQLMFLEDLIVKDDYGSLDLVVDRKELDLFMLKNKNKGGEEVLERLSFSLGSILATYRAYDAKDDHVFIRVLDAEDSKELSVYEFPKDFQDIMALKK